MNPYWHVSAQLYSAIKENKYEEVENILNSGFDVDHEILPKKTAISIAVLENRVEIVKLLLSKSCSLSLKTDLGYTPLHLSVMMQNAGMVQLLLRNRADMTQVDFSGKTPLLAACEFHTLRIAILLVEFSTPYILNLRDKDRKTCLMYACRHAPLNFIRSLILKGAKADVCDNRGNNALMYALMNPMCDAEMLHLLLDAGININHQNGAKETALLKACGKFSYMNDKHFRDICSVLLDRGSDPNIRNGMMETALHIAVQTNDKFLVRKLLNAGSDVNAVNVLSSVPLHSALRKGFHDIATLLIEDGANVAYACNLAKMQYIVSSLILNDINKLLRCVMIKSKECKSLAKLCRSAIRKNIKKSIDKTALQLPLPQPLIRFIQLLDC